MKTLCKACANLYGVIVAQDVWEIYRELSNNIDLPFIHKRELLTALKIFRREDLPFYVFELDEVFDEETKIDRYMVIISKDLLGYGLERFYSVYDVLDNREGTKFFVVENLLDYAEPKPNPCEKMLLHKLSNMKCTESEYKDPYSDEKYPCKYQGLKLNEFHFISRTEQLELDRLSKKGKNGPTKYYEHMLQETKKYNAAEKIVNNIKFNFMTGEYYGPDAVQYLLKSLHELGVVPKGNELTACFRLILEWNNHMHQWGLAGWTPDDLSAVEDYNPSGAPTIEIGPNLRKMIQNGEISEEELQSGIDSLRKKWTM